MLEVQLSNSLEALAGILAERLRSSGKGIFEATTIVVPNATVRTYAQLEIARRLGIAANLDFVFLQSFFAGLVPDAEREGFGILDRDVLRSLLLGLLADEALLAKPVLGPVRDYLFAAGTDPDVVDRRRFQLAGQIARLFDDYALTRPELVEAWRRRTTLPEEHTQATTEAWERDLWLAIFGKEGRLAEVARAKDGVTWLSLPELLERFGPAKLNVPDELHVFGFSTIAPIHQKVLVKLADRSKITIYGFSPGSRLDGPGLGRFGMPARESLELWKSRGVEPMVRLVTPTGTTLLERLQHELLLEKPAAGKAKPDDSFRVLACPSIAREVEIVASEIWELVRSAHAAGRKLRFNEMAILIAGRDQDAYRSQIAAVLPQAHEIPVSSAALFRPQESRALEAVRLLLDLPLGTFKRDELLRLLVHPNVLALVPDAESDKWLEWCDELEILAGADRADLAATYVRGDLYNWDQGLKRLALGAFMSGERSRDPSFVRIGGEDYLPLDHAQDELSSAASLILLARGLLADARAARAGSHTLTEWADYFQRLVSGYLAPTEDDEEKILGIAARRLRALEDLDFDARPVSYRIAYELALAAIDSLGENRGRDLADGVVVAPLLPGRPIPFKAVFVLGLGEGSFPAKDRVDLLDLRATERRPGDVSPQERDRLTFLETLAATRERLTLSYVARDATTGERLAPSSVVREVEAALASCLDANEIASLTVHHELRRYDPSYFAPPLGGHEPSAWSVPEAFREAQVRALRDQRLALPGSETARTVVESLAPVPRAVLGELLGVLPSYSGTSRPRDTVRVSIRALQDFLLSPLQGWAQRELWLRRDDDDEDVILRGDEAFEPSPLVETIFLREVVSDALRRGGDLGAAIDAAHAEHTRRGELTGTLPTGVFLEVAKRGHARILEQWSGNLSSALTQEERTGLVPHRFGASEDFGASDVLHSPVIFELEEPRKVRVELTGRTGSILPGESGSVVFVAKEQPDEKHTLGGFLDHALLAAAGLACAKKTFRVFAIPARYGAGRSSERAFKPLTTKQASGWLEKLVTDFLTGTHAYLLSIEPVLEFLRIPANKYSLEDKIVWWRDKSRRKPSDAWGPIRNWQRYGPPPDAEKLARRRLGPYVERAANGGAA
ncbi:exodeoxyribonuclease V subunit gamma [bacterium]|nr:exodeoxyribonuclease V subunit gamma [bacterium]